MEVECRWCHLFIEKDRFGIWVHAEGWASDGYTHDPGQSMCEPDMQTTYATPKP